MGYKMTDNMVGILFGIGMIVGLISMYVALHYIGKLIDYVRNKK